MNIAAPPPHGILGVVGRSAGSFPDSLVGATVRGRYRIDNILQVGDHAVVTRATHLAGGRAVALKIASPYSTPDVKREFERVALMVSELEHPQVPRTFDLGETEDGDPFVAFELYDGGTLADLEGPVDPTRAVRLVVQILHGLRYIHGRGILHCNLCPENLVLGSSADDAEQIKLIGFDHAVAGTARPVTMSNLLSGAPGYIAPEQIVGLESDRRADLYALGVIFYELLTGASPWPSRDPDQILELQTSRALPTLPGELSTFDTIVQRLAAREPIDRFGSAAAALEALEGCVLGRGEATIDAKPEASIRTRPRDGHDRHRASPRRAWVAGAALVVAVLIAGSAYGLMREDEVLEAAVPLRTASVQSIEPERRDDRVVPPSAPVPTPPPAIDAPHPAPAAAEQPPPPDPVPVPRSSERRRQRRSEDREALPPPPEPATETAEVVSPPPAEEPAALEPEPATAPILLEDKPAAPASPESPLMKPNPRRGTTNDVLLRP